MRPTLSLLQCLNWTNVFEVMTTLTGGGNNIATSADSISLCSTIAATQKINATADDGILKYTDTLLRPLPAMVPCLRVPPLPAKLHIKGDD